MRQLLTYLTVGGATALLYLVVAVVLSRYLGVPPQWASSLAFLTAVPFSYAGHKYLTFRSAGEHRVELPRFVTMAVLGLAVTWSLPDFAVRVWHAPPLAAYAATSIAVPALNYAMMWLWVFVEGRRGRPAAMTR